MHVVWVKRLLRTAEPVGNPASKPVPKFDSASHHAEIAEVAFFKWLERTGTPGSPEEDWLNAEIEVHARLEQRDFLEKDPSKHKPK